MVRCGCESLSFRQNDETLVRQQRQKLGDGEASGADGTRLPYSAQVTSLVVETRNFCVESFHSFICRTRATSSKIGSLSFCFYHRAKRSTVPGQSSYDGEVTDPQSTYRTMKPACHSQHCLPSWHVSDPTVSRHLEKNFRPLLSALISICTGVKSHRT